MPRILQILYVNQIMTLNIKRSGNFNACIIFCFYFRRLSICNKKLIVGQWAVLGFL